VQESLESKLRLKSYDGLKFTDQKGGCRPGWGGVGCCGCGEKEKKEGGGEGSVPAEGIGAQEWFMVEFFF
jgi:hypothetical protein